MIEEIKEKGIAGIRKYLTLETHEKSKYFRLYVDKINPFLDLEMYTYPPLVYDENLPIKTGSLPSYSGKDMNYKIIKLVSYFKISGIDPKYMPDVVEEIKEEVIVGLEKFLKTLDIKRKFYYMYMYVRSQIKTVDALEKNPHPPVVYEDGSFISLSLRQMFQRFGGLFTIRVLDYFKISGFNLDHIFDIHIDIVKYFPFGAGHDFEKFPTQYPTAKVCKWLKGETEVREFISLDVVYGNKYNISALYPIYVKYSGKSAFEILCEISSYINTFNRALRCKFPFERLFTMVNPYFNYAPREYHFCGRPIRLANIYYYPFIQYKSEIAKLDIVYNSNFRIQKLPIPKWDTNCYKQYPLEFKRQVKTLLLYRARHRRSLDKNLLYRIFEYMLYSFFKAELAEIDKLKQTLEVMSKKYNAVNMECYKRNIFPTFNTELAAANLLAYNNGMKFEVSNSDIDELASILHRSKNVKKLTDILREKYYEKYYIECPTSKDLTAFLIRESLEKGLTYQDVIDGANPFSEEPTERKTKKRERQEISDIHLVFIKKHNKQLSQILNSTILKNNEVIELVYQSISLEKSKEFFNQWTNRGEEWVVTELFIVSIPTNLEINKESISKFKSMMKFFQ